MTDVLRRRAPQRVAIVLTTLLLAAIAFAGSAGVANAAPTPVDPTSHGYCTNWRGFESPLFPGSVVYVPSIGAGFTSTHCVMSQGANSNGVRALQRALGYCERISAGPVDGIYGTQTRNAVIIFQQRAGITADGVYGPQTRDRLRFAWFNGNTHTGCAEPGGWPN